MVQFSDATRSFLRDLAGHNDKAWFDANRARYERDYVAVGKALVEEVSAATGVAGKTMRIFRDVRFSKDKTPYKPHLDAWFCTPGPDAWGPGLFCRLEPDSFLVGVGCHALEKVALAKFRDGVVKDGAALRAAVGNSNVGGSTLKRFPKGYPEDPYMLHTGFYVEHIGAVPSDPVEHIVSAYTKWQGVWKWLAMHAT